ncbi:alpha-1-acid glycoprotein 2-like [Halichoerus grypus]|uniref:alpha-1-acid glycoprotein 2-like n=1 Tax=Phoca vitulina TaxID=9720 RepID=UPI0013965A20|nr:alpha-1-acid glycoprotein 2-like [Phoca vitulina]XP_035977802.1 alpha-1-acid glycoprotein 2-like [Halichoerus grypus]
MALSWALAALSLLPLLDAQSPVCANLTATPITNATLEQISGKWFYIASAFRNPEFNQSSRTIHSAFFYFALNHTDDTILLAEYLSIGNRCIYNSSYLKVQRKNGTVSKEESGKEVFADLLLTKDPKIFMFGFYLKDKQNKGLSFYADKPEVTEEQMRVFHEAIGCIGMQKSEISYTDAKKDLCGPLEKEHKEGRPKEKEGDTALG